MRCALLILALTLALNTTHAQEARKGTVSVTALDPAALVAGRTATLKLRGFKLADATGIRFPKAPAAKAEIRENTKADTVKGLGDDVTGDTLITAEFILPDEFPAGPLEFIIATPAGEAAGTIPVVAASSVLEEAEPNNGFGESQKLEPGQSVRGSIEGEKDVDVYEVSARAGQRFRIRVTGGSVITMDAVLTCYDFRGQFLAASDDLDGSRDPGLSVTAPADGPIRLCLGDAHERGGPWHSYLLNVEEEK